MTPERWQQLEPLLHDALDLPPDQRDAFLAQACHGDGSLRLELEALLAEEEGADEFLAAPLLAGTDKIHSSTLEEITAPTTQSLSGQQLGSYQLRSLLGKGGMGEVYLAEDPRLQRKVALKLLPPHIARDPEQTARFKREARMLAKLDNHPNIAVIHAFEPDEAAPFLVLEYVPGQTLAERLQHGAMPLAEALPLFQQIASALAEAGKQGIIHRDLKPANIKITPAGRVKVLDFGLAKLLQQEAPTADMLASAQQLLTTRTYWTTERQVILGTVPYMSPEQTRGLLLDQRTDLWAFGCILFEALAGARPFQGSDTFELFHAIRTQEPAWHLLPAETPQSIRTLLQQCLQKAPESRLASATEALHVLTQAMEKAQPKPRRFAWQRWKKQIVFTVVASLAITLGVVYRQPIRARVTSLFAATETVPRLPLEKSLVVLPFKDEAGKVGAGLAKSLQDTLATAPELHVLPFAQAAQANVADATAPQRRKALGVNLFLDGEIQRNGNQVTIQFWVEDLQARRLYTDKVEGQNHEYAQLQAAVAGKVAAALQTKLSPFPAQKAFQNPASDEQYLAALSGLQSDLTRETIKPVVDSLLDLHKKEKDSARVLAALSRAYFYQAQSSHDEALADKAVQFAEQAIRSNPQATEAHVVSGQALLFLEKYDEAIKAFRVAFDKQPGNYDALVGLAWAYEGAKQWREAWDFYQSAVAHWPNYWGIHNELGRFHFRQKRYQEAREEWTRVIALNPEGIIGWENLGHAYLSLGDYVQAEIHYREAINKAVGKQQTSEDAYIGWGTAQYYQKRYAEAEQSFRAGLKLNDRAPVIWGNLGDALRQQTGKEQAAFDAYKEAIRLTQRFTAAALDYPRLAEYYAKRSTIRIPDPMEQATDKQRAQYFLRLALQGNEQDVEMLSTAILVSHLLGDDPRALEYLQKARPLGLTANEIEREPDLRPLRLLPQYTEIFKQPLPSSATK